MLPVEQANPGGQAMQSLCEMPPSELRKLPAAHDVGEATPDGQKDPAGQSTQLDAPGAD